MSHSSHVLLRTTKTYHVCISIFSTIPHHISKVLWARPHECISFERLPPPPTSHYESTILVAQAWRLGMSLLLSHPNFLCGYDIQYKHCLPVPPIPTPTTLRWPLLPNASLHYSNDLNVPVNSVKAVMRNLLQTLKFRYDHDSPLLNSTWWFVFPFSNVYALRHDIKDLYCCSLSPFGISPSTPLGTQTSTPHLHNFTPSPICKTLLWIPSDPQNAQLKCQ